MLLTFQEWQPYKRRDGSQGFRKGAPGRWKYAPKGFKPGKKAKPKVVKKAIKEPKVVKVAAIKKPPKFKAGFSSKVRGLLEGIAGGKFPMFKKRLKSLSPRAIEELALVTGPFGLPGTLFAEFETFQERGRSRFISRIRTSTFKSRGAGVTPVFKFETEEEPKSELPTAIVPPSMRKLPDVPFTPPVKIKDGVPTVAMKVSPVAPVQAAVPKVAPAGFAPKARKLPTGPPRAPTVAAPPKPKRKLRIEKLRFGLKGKRASEFTFAEHKHNKKRRKLLDAMRRMRKAT